VDTHAMAVSGLRRVVIGLLSGHFSHDTLAAQAAGPAYPAGPRNHDALIHFLGTGR